MTSGIMPFKEGTVPCLQLQEGVLGSKKGSAPFKNSLARTLFGEAGGSTNG